MPTSAQVKELIAQMPALKGVIEPQPWDNVFKACTVILENPKENVVGIIEAFGEVDNGKDYKARYLLRSVVTVSANEQFIKTKHEEVIAAVASQLTTERGKEVKAALIRELRFAGTPSASKAIAPFVTDEQLCSDACNALRSIQVGATAILLAALPVAKGKARTEIVHALAALGEATALEALRGALADPELDTRIAAAWGLGRLADAANGAAILAAADKAEGWERVQMTNAALILAESLIAAGKKADAAKVYTSLKDTRKDPSEKYIVDLATRALAV